MSLANRLALLFAACTAAVALLAGALFSRASEMHFIELDQQQLQGKLAVFSELLQGVTSTTALAALRPALEQELQRHPELALRIEGPDGQVWFSSRALPDNLPQTQHWNHQDTAYRVMSAKQGDLRLTLLLDITHHQHFLEQMQRLIWLCVGLSAFSADIAHELRTPLSNLLTQTQVILSQPRALEDYQEALHSNLEELQHLAQMVGDMLLLAKADNGLLQTRRETLALERELTTLAEYFTPLAEEAGVRLQVEGQATLSADRPLLHRALSNLIDNALRFTPRGGELRLSAAQQGAKVRIEVANQGPEIPAAQRERLFDRFYRADPARREGGAEHAGLGLAIARSIVQAHGGAIRCESAEGWTRFILEFPA